MLGVVPDPLFNQVSISEFRVVSPMCFYDVGAGAVVESVVCGGNTDHAV